MLHRAAVGRERMVSTKGFFDGRLERVVRALLNICIRGLPLPVGVALRSEIGCSLELDVAGKQ